MVPMGKPIQGHEKEYLDLFYKIKNFEPRRETIIEKLLGRKPPDKNELKQRWRSLCVSPYETIGAPRVGRDKEADEHVVNVLYEGNLKPEYYEGILKQYDGYYFGSLAKNQGGVTVYSQGEEDRISFYGWILEDCEQLFADGLLSEVFETKLWDETREFGYRIMSATDEIAIPAGLTSLRNVKPRPDVQEDSLESKVHILYSLANWLVFWGSNGHGYEADY